MGEFKNETFPWKALGKKALWTDKINNEINKTNKEIQIIKNEVKENWDITTKEDYKEMVEKVKNLEKVDKYFQLVWWVLYYKKEDWSIGLGLSARATFSIASNTKPILSSENVPLGCPSIRSSVWFPSTFWKLTLTYFVSSFNQLII